MTEKLEIEFDDRYGGRKLPWNYCRGGCEAMGVVPVNLPMISLGFDPSGDDLGEVIVVSVEDDRLYTRAVADHERGVGHEDGVCDGWHFVQCPGCGGTGEVSKVRALRYLPGEAWRTLRFVWDHGVRGYARPPWMSWREQMVMVLRIAVGLTPR